MTDTQNSTQTSITDAVESKTQDAAEAATTKASGAKDSIVNDIKVKGKTITQKIASLPGAAKAKFFVGIGLVLASLVSYIAVFFVGSKALFLLAGVFYPIAVAAVTILSAYNQNDFFEALFAGKKKKELPPKSPEIHSEEVIHETHEHDEIENDEA